MSGTLVYLVVLAAGAVLVGVASTRSGAPVAAWPLLVVPPLVAGLTAVLVATARAGARPPRTRGLVAVAVPAVAAAVLTTVSAVQAAARADVPAGVRAADLAVPVVVLLLTGGLGGLLAHLRWKPSTRPSYAEGV
ncbi:hypothetical protein ATM99_08440 [Cellulomonas sp. B6]|nr:hypothetical protein ATM99_08440 [Cellulomonas sp. B6]